MLESFFVALPVRVLSKVSLLGIISERDNLQPIRERVGIRPKGPGMQAAAKRQEIMDINHFKSMLKKFRRLSRNTKSI